MRMLKPICLLLSGIFLSGSAFATDAQMKETLVRIIEQLETIKPLITRAEKEQPHHPRIKVNFDRFKGEDGKYHNGVRQDIEIIQRSLVRIVNQETVEPRVEEPVADDFIDELSHGK